MINSKLKNTLIRLMPEALLVKLKSSVNGKKSNPVWNINFNALDNKQKKVFIAYQTAALTTNRKDWTGGTRNIENSCIIRFFIDKGFSVDLGDANDHSIIHKTQKNSYDVIFGFGSLFYELSKLNPDAKKILYLTEKHPEYSYQQEKQRIDYFKERHGRTVSHQRSGQYYKKEYFDIADGIIYVGRPSDALLIPGNTMKLPNIVTGLVNDAFDLKLKNYTQSKHNFLWFGSQGAIHKGLDILIDVFKAQTENTLYIAGLSAIDKKMLGLHKDSATIKDLGFINVQSSEFNKLMASCNYVILPSCSEGISTSVITCMNHGLIPIVTEDCGFEPNPGILLLESYKVEDVSKKMREILNWDIEKIVSMSHHIKEYSLKQFNIAEFSAQISSNLEALLK